MYKEEDVTEFQYRYLWERHSIGVIFINTIDGLVVQSSLYFDVMVCKELNCCDMYQYIQYRFVIDKDIDWGLRCRSFSKDFKIGFHEGTDIEIWYPEGFRDLSWSEVSQKEKDNCIDEEFKFWLGEIKNPKTLVKR